ncbi:MAG: hypothetical protein ACD_11C00020G0057 [uncultured bacterium]|nr:MAG: hypothetical protein ACD_11C00020G0057 [uncultured bacterium]HBR71342.1 hypothetical protein [Candidatus Moranbacteria bacterium]
MRDLFRNREIIGAIFVTLFVSIFALANILAGFSLPVYILAIVPAVLIAFLYPQSGFFAIVFLTFIFERFFTLAPIVMGRNEYKLYPLDILLTAVVFGIVFQFLRGKLEIVFKKADYFIWGFIIVCAIYGVFDMFVLQADKALSFSSAKNYALYAILYFVTFLLIKTKKDFENFAKLAVFGGLCILGFLIYGISSGQGLWSEYTPLSTEGVRILAFTHSYYLSMLSVFAFVYILARKNDNESKIFIALLCFWAVGIVGSMMRHLWIALGAAFLTVLILLANEFRKNIKNIIIPYVAILFIASIPILYFSFLFPNSDLNKRIQEVTGVVSHRVTSIADSDDESIFWRNVVWQEALKKYKDSLVFGTGLGKYLSVEIGTYRNFVEMRNVHNSFLVLLVQMGVLGVAFLFIPIGVLAKNIFRKIRDKDEFYVERITVLGILALQLVAFMFQPYLETNLLGIFFWINLGLMRSLSYKNEEV